MEALLGSGFFETVQRALRKLRQFSNPNSIRINIVTHELALSLRCNNKSKVYQITHQREVIKMKFSTANIKNADYSENHVIYVGSMTGSVKSKKTVNFRTLFFVLTMRIF